MESRVRRIVTGHDDRGRSVVAQDGAARAEPLGGDGVVFHEIWRTRETPARIGRLAEDDDEPGVTLPPPRGGTRLRFVDFPPERERAEPITPEQARAAFAAIGAPDAAMHHGEASPHPFMHRTETVDYGIVLEGEIILVLDGGETLLTAGDVVIQRGTSHAWANRSNRLCRMAFVLIDGALEPPPTG
jgi:mannose-6-phosphate isomerase-like protein (cupin superfamily)